MIKKIQITLSILAMMTTVSPVFAICFFGFGNTCEKQDIINTATNKVQATVKSGADSKSNAKVDIGETTQTVNADVIKRFLNAEEANTLFIPLTNASTKQIEFQQKTVGELKEFAKTVVQSNQDFIKAQAAEQRKFTEELVNKVITGPPTIPLRSASSSFPIELFNNNQTTPLWVKYVDPITINNITAGSTASSTNSMINTSQQKLQIKLLADFPAGGSIGSAATTVDVASFFEIAQTTAGQTVTLPTPTVTTDSTFAYIKNTGTTDLVVVGTTVTAGSTILFTFSNGSWGLFGAEAASATPLTYGRVNAAANLASKSFVSTGVGSTVDFTATVYSSGMTFSGTNGITPSVTGRYRAAYYLNAGSDVTAENATIEIVQGGVSLGSVYINQHQSAGSVNQTAGFIDVNVVAGTPVFLHYRPDVTEAVAFDRGSYFQLTQLPTAVAPIVNTVAEYGEAAMTDGASVSTTAFTDFSTNQTVTVPSAGTWRVSYIVNGGNTVGNRQATLRVLDVTAGNILVPNSVSAGQRGSDFQGSLITQTFFVTTTGANTYKLQGAAQTGSSFNIYNNTVAANPTGSSKWVYEKIAGQLPSTGTTVDYVEVQLTANISVVTNTPILFNSILGGNIPYNTGTGRFTLTAGKTYQLTSNASIAGGTSEVGSVAWYNVTTGAYISPTASTMASSASHSRGDTQAMITFTPSVTTEVELRNNTSGTRTFGGTVIGTQLQGASTARIVQLGSTAITTNTLASVNASNSSGQSIPNAANTVITNWTETVDEAGNFNPTTGVFTAPRTADYIINSLITASSSAWTAGQEWTVIIRKNGSTLIYASNDTQAAGTFIIAGVNNVTVRLAANDTIDIAILHSRGAATTLLPAGNRNYLSIKELPTTN